MSSLTLQVCLPRLSTSPPLRADASKAPSEAAESLGPGVSASTVILYCCNQSMDQSSNDNVKTCVFGNVFVDSACVSEPYHLDSSSISMRVVVRYVYNLWSVIHISMHYAATPLCS